MIFTFDIHPGTLEIEYFNCKQNHSLNGIPATVKLHYTRLSFPVFSNTHHNSKTKMDGDEIDIYGSVVTIK